MDAVGTMRFSGFMLEVGFLVAVCVYNISLPVRHEFYRPFVTFANNLDPDEAPQNVEPHLRSKLFDTQIIYQQMF